MSRYKLNKAEMTNLADVDDLLHEVYHDCEDAGTKLEKIARLQKRMTEWVLLTRYLTHK